MWRFPVEAVPICPLSQSSRVRVLTVDFGAVVPETQELEDGTRRKVLDAARILNVEKDVGVTFSRPDGEVIKKLMVLKDIDVEKKRC